MISVMINDGHPQVRERLEVMLSHSTRVTVATTVSSGKEAAAWCRKNGAPDIILCDVLMQKEDGFSVLENLERAFGDVKLIFLSGVSRKREGALVDFASGHRRTAKSPFSPRERETLKYLALGKTREEISIIMGCGTETTKTRVAEIRRKLDASNTTAAIARAYELGYLV